jgi:hypothetical protein
MPTKKGQPPRPLVDAAEKLHESLASHARVTRELAKVEYDSRQSVARAEELLGKLSGHDHELAADMQAFVTALTAARESQQADADKNQTRALELVERKGELSRLDTRLKLLADAVKAVRSLLERLRDAGAGGAGAPEAITKLADLAALAEGVMQDARAAGFEDVARDAHAMHQQLDAVLRKAAALDKKVPQA